MSGMSAMNRQPHQQKHTSMGCIQAMIRLSILLTEIAMYEGSVAITYGIE